MLHERLKIVHHMILNDDQYNLYFCVLEFLSFQQILSLFFNKILK